MISYERQMEILNYLNKKHFSTVKELAKIIWTSESSVRRDIKELEQKGMKLYATTPRSEADKITNVSFKGGVVAVIGNEGNGVSDEIFSVCNKITIPMGGRAESLNASMAAAITMWEMMRNG